MSVVQPLNQERSKGHTSKMRSKDWRLSSHLKRRKPYLSAHVSYVFYTATLYTPYPPLTQPSKLTMWSKGMSDTGHHFGAICCSISLCTKKNQVTTERAYLFRLYECTISCRGFKHMDLQGIAVTEHLKPQYTAAAVPQLQCGVSACLHRTSQVSHIPCIRHLQSAFLLHFASGCGWFDGLFSVSHNISYTTPNLLEQQIRRAQVSRQILPGPVRVGQ